MFIYNVAWEISMGCARCLNRHTQAYLHFHAVREVWYTIPDLPLCSEIAPSKKVQCGKHSNAKCSICWILSLLAYIRTIQVSFQYNLECGILYLYYNCIVLIFNQLLISINNVFWFSTSLAPVGIVADQNYRRFILYPNSVLVFKLR